jgi:hypothetical protein
MGDTLRISFIAWSDAEGGDKLREDAANWRDPVAKKGRTFRLLQYDGTPQQWGFAATAPHDISVYIHGHSRTNCPYSWPGKGDVLLHAAVVARRLVASGLPATGCKLKCYMCNSSTAGPYAFARVFAAVMRANGYGNNHLFYYGYESTLGGYGPFSGHKTAGIKSAIPFLGHRAEHTPRDPRVGGRPARGLHELHGDGRQRHAPAWRRGRAVRRRRPRHRRQAPSRGGGSLRASRARRTHRGGRPRPRAAALRGRTGSPGAAVSHRTSKTTDHRRTSSVGALRRRHPAGLRARGPRRGDRVSARPRTRARGRCPQRQLDHPRVGHVDVRSDRLDGAPREKDIDARRGGVAAPAARREVRRRRFTRMPITQARAEAGPRDSRSARASPGGDLAA